MLRKNHMRVVFTLSGMLLLLGLSVNAQVTFRREADYLKARRALAAQRGLLEQPVASSARRQPTVRRVVQSSVAVSQAEATAPAYFQADEKFAGRTVSEYSGDFLHFLFTRPGPDSLPFEQMAKGIEFQHGPVWFLTQTFDGAPEREVMVPKNTPVFFSLGWAFGFLFDEDPDEAMFGLRGFLSTVPEYFTDFYVELDYEVLPREAIVATQSPTTYFPATAEVIEVLQLPVPPMSRVFSRAAIGGNFVLLKPLSEGTHVLKMRFQDIEGNRYIREYYLCVL